MSSSSVLFTYIFICLSSWICYSIEPIDPFCQSSRVATVFSNDEGYFFIKEGVADADNGIAWGSFNDGLFKNGWGELNIQTSSKWEDESQAFAAGMIEGYLTAHHITTTVNNLIPQIFKGKTSMPDKVRDFMDRQEEWMEDMANTHGKADVFFHHVGLIKNQYDGLIEGFAQSNEEFLPHWAFQMLNGVGDLFDIIPAIQENEKVDWENLEKYEAQELHSQAGHCSAFIKLFYNGDKTDIFLSHSSWFTFANTNRIFKHYTFNFHAPTAAQGISFSSYPGFLNSLDDFYMLSSGISWVQTTNTVLDHSTYKDTVRPESLLAWHRVRVASAMARTPREWYEVFRREASGTYANQYSIVDLKKIVTTGLVPDTFWVVEEMPGLVHGEDQTQLLHSQLYWASYNVPFYKDNFEKSGYPSMVKKFGDYWSHDEAPRAKIFRRDHSRVVDIESLQTLMRENKYTTDPLSFDGKIQNPSWAICARADLNANNTNPSGCYDTKVTSWRYGAMQRKAMIVNGPTSVASKGSLPVFSWKKYPKLRHSGLPQQYSFGFIPTEPHDCRVEEASGVSAIE